MDLIPSTQPMPIRKYVSLGNTTETILWTPTLEKKWVITDLIISSTATCLVTLRDGSAGTIIMIGRCTTSYPFIVNLTRPIMSIAANRNLTVQTSAITAYVAVAGYEE